MLKVTIDFFQQEHLVFNQITDEPTELIELKNLIKKYLEYPKFRDFFEKYISNYDISDEKDTTKILSSIICVYFRDYGFSLPFRPMVGDLLDLDFLLTKAEIFVFDRFFKDLLFRACLNFIQ